MCLVVSCRRGICVFKKRVREHWRSLLESANVKLLFELFKDTNLLPTSLMIKRYLSNLVMLALLKFKMDFEGYKL